MFVCSGTENDLSDDPIENSSDDDDSIPQRRQQQRLPPKRLDFEEEEEGANRSPSLSPYYLEDRNNAKRSKSRSPSLSPYYSDADDFVPEEDENRNNASPMDLDLFDRDLQEQEAFEAYKLEMEEAKFRDADASRSQVKRDARTRGDPTCVPYNPDSEEE
jgi:hypothetical protein